MPKRKTVLKYLVKFLENRKLAIRIERKLYKHTKKADYDRIAYQLIGLVSEKRGKSDVSFLILNIEKCTIDLQSFIYSDLYTDRENEFLQFLQKAKAVKGVYKCNKECGSDLFFIWMEQTRSGDEGMTAFRQCAKCGKRGKE